MLKDTVRIDFNFIYSMDKGERVKFQQDICALTNNLLKCPFCNSPLKDPLYICGELDCIKCEARVSSKMNNFLSFIEIRDIEIRGRVRVGYINEKYIVYFNAVKKYLEFDTLEELSSTIKDIDNLFIFE
jgi:hypothetical protein